MGFGYLFLGYLTTFLLKMLASALGVGSLALLIGYFLMWTGLRTLRLYCRSFSFAEWVLYPMMATGLFGLIRDLSTLFLWNVAWLDGVASVMIWVDFVLIMIYHAALLSAIREIGTQVELKRIPAAAIRNSVIVFLYAVVYMLYFIPGLFPEAARSYLTLSMTLLNIAWIICNLLLLLNCTKDIVAQGQEDPEPKHYKWEFLNRMGDQFEENMKKAADSNREAIEEHLRKKRERRNGAMATSVDVPKKPKKKKKK